MKRGGNILFIGLFLILLIGIVSASNFTVTFGGSSADEGRSIVRDYSEGYTIAGHTISYGPGSYDVWLININSTGDHQWNKTFGGSNVDLAYSLIKTSDGGYAIFGATKSFGVGGDYDFWLIKTDSSGDHQWNKTFHGTGSDRGWSAIQTSDNGYALLGQTSTNNNDFWLIKTDSSGDHQWNKTFGSSTTDIGYSIIQTSDNGYALLGTTGGPGNIDLWLIKTDSSGDHQWNKTFGGPYNEECAINRGIIQTSDNGYAFGAGYDSTGSDYDYWLIKTDNSGDHQWNQTYNYAPRNYHDRPQGGVIQTSDGGFALVGQVGGDPEYDIVVVKTDSSGNKESDTSFGDGNDDAKGYGIIQTSDGGFALVGKRNPDYWGGGNDDLIVIRYGEQEIKGNLSAEMITSSTSISKYELLNISSNVTCTGGDCGEVSAWLDPVPKKKTFFQWLLSLFGKSTGYAAGDLVSTATGAIPFYSTDRDNPESCGTMSDGDNCTNTWEVNATGDAGDYEFFVKYNSTDAGVDEQNTSSITITIEEEEEEQPSEGGGSNTHSIKDKELIKGISKRLKENDKIKFEHKNKDHKITIKGISRDKIKIIIESNPIEIELSEGETKKVDIDNDGIYDLLIRLDKIVSTSTVEVFTQKISEPITPEPEEELPSPVPQEEPEEVPIPEEEEEEDYTTTILVIIIILTILIITLWSLKPKKK